MIISSQSNKFEIPHLNEGFNLIQTIQWTRTSINEEDDSKNALESARLFSSYLPALPTGYWK